MREKLIELLKETDRAAFEALKDREDCDDNMVFEFYADYFVGKGVTVPDTNVGKWIPVTERLPDNEQRVLCFMGSNDFGAFRVFQWSYIDWQWNDGNEWYDEKDVTHWMPLPEPPKGE